MNNALHGNSYHAILVLFFLAVFMQMSNVFFFHDDFGYLTLSYANIAIPGANGTNYGLRELLQFLYQHYMTWGGRALYFFFEIALGFKNVWILRIVQSLVITLIAALMIRDNENNKYSAIVVVMAYFSLPLTMVADSLYWYTASAVYLFPLLPFFAGCIFFYRLCFKGDVGKGEKQVMYISLFFASFSQEQIACATVFFVTACLFLTKFSNDPSYGTRNEYIAATAVTYLGFLLLIAAPGSWNRAALDDMALADRIVLHASQVVHHQYLHDGKIYQTILIVINALMTLHLYRKKAAGLFFTAFSSVLSAFLLYINMRFLDGCFNGLMHFTGYRLGITSLVLLLFSLTVICTVFLYCKKIKGSMDKFLFLLAGLVSLAIMLVIPSAVPYRSALPFTFIMILILSDMAKEICSVERFKVINATWICALSVMALANYAGIVEGYAANGVVHRKNDFILRDAVEKISDGNDIKSVTLYKTLDDTYGTTPAYEREYIPPWIRKFYGLPEDTELVFVDYP